MTPDYEALAERVKRAYANLTDAHRQAIKAGLVVDVDEMRIHEVGMAKSIPTFKVVVLLPIG